jgi:hypothetical protein
MTCHAPSPVHLPVSDAQGLADRVGELLPVAVRRQLWTLFFDADDVQLPMMVPLEGIPDRPSPSAVRSWGLALEAVVDEFDVAWVCFVVERPGGAEETESDTAWCEELVALGASTGLVVRSVLGCTDDGIRPWVVTPSPAMTRAATGPAVIATRRSDDRHREAGGDGLRTGRTQSSPSRLALAEVLPLR